MKDVILFEVPPNEIKAGIENETHDLMKECPVAITLKKRYPEAENVEVSSDKVTIDGDTYVDNDGMLSDFVSVFDNITDRDSEETELLESWIEHGCPIELRRDDYV